MALLTVNPIETTHQNEGGTMVDSVKVVLPTVAAGGWKTQTKTLGVEVASHCNSAPFPPDTIPMISI